MSQIADLIKTRFCWVKAVMQSPVCVEDAQAPWTLPCVEAGMPPPPAPHGVVDARGVAATAGSTAAVVGTRGSGTPPPTTESTPSIQASVGGKDFWQMSSFSPGATTSAGAPVVTLCFMPIDGSAADVRAWRRKNPDWFKDAVALTLLSYEP